MLNKKETTAKILAACKTVPCTKLPIDNILFPAWDELGLLGQLVRQCVCTKEQPEGYIYPEANFRMVMRILSGKLLINLRPDVYCWRMDKVQKSLKNAKIIGTNSAEGLINLVDVLQSINSDEEKTAFAGMMASLKRDLLLVHTPAEKRECIIVTQEMLDTGITACVDSFVDTDADGNGPESKLFLGDAIIVNRKPTGDKIYRIGKEEFSETHSLN